MTNKERYQRTFSALHTSAQCVKEVDTMTKTRKIRPVRVLALVAAIVLLLGLATVAYAADVGHIQRAVQLWFHGDQTDAVLEIEQGEYTEYTATYTDEEGNTHEVEGGGAAFDIFGRPVALTEEEILEHINSPQVEYLDDGSVWVFYHEQKIEITDKFDEDGVCYVKLQDGDDNYYMTIEYQQGYCISTNRFAKPSSSH